MQLNNDEPKVESSAEPIEIIQRGERKITLLGTAHISKASADKVIELLDSNEFDAVAIELCPSRHNALINPDAMSKMDLFKVIREGQASMVAASLALGAYQQRLADQFGIKPGQEMCAAIKSAQKHHLDVLLIDREIGTTLKRVYKSVPWWKRFSIVSSLFGSVVTRQEVSEDEIEKLKQGDILESTFSQFSEEANDIYIPLVDERDRYMAARIEQELINTEHKNILVVIGAGHLKGMKKYLDNSIIDPDQTIEQLDHIPEARSWWKFLPWIIIALIISGFIIGFSRNTDLGLDLVKDWILINGGLAAIGATLALAHPITILGTFLAAPLTSLNPMVGVGMAAAAIESVIRKPSVGDFERLRTDTVHWKGWWTNRVTRILLIFILSSLGSGAGTYIAGFRIFGKLAS